MVYAQPGQIIEYKSPTNDYVKQYEAIPESGVFFLCQKHFGIQNHIINTFASRYLCSVTISNVTSLKYLRLQSEITTRSENITVLQRELVSAQEENTTKYNAISCFPFSCHIPTLF